MPQQFAKEVKCRVLDVIWVSPSVVRIRFEPSRKFDFKPGQFLSVVIPPFKKGGKAVKRCYSFASGPEEAKRNGYELCVKYVEGGIGSGYLGSLTPGDTFTAVAPFGDFVYDNPGEGRSVCFIATGTGVAPFRSAVYSEAFQANRPEHAMMLMGVGSQKEILYKGEFANMGVEEVHAVSRPEAGWNGFTGRVTDYLRQMPRSWQWHATDFYLCGSGPMIHEVSTILQRGFGVSAGAVHLENFSSPSVKAKPVAVAQEEKQRGKFLPFGFAFPKVA